MRNKLMLPVLVVCLLAVPVHAKAVPSSDQSTSGANSPAIISGGNVSVIYGPDETNILKKEKITLLTELNKKLVNTKFNVNAEDYEIIYGDGKNIEQGRSLFVRLATEIVDAFHKESVWYESNSHLFSKINKTKLDFLKRRANDDLTALRKEYARARSQGENTLGRNGGLVLKKVVDSSGTFLKEFSAATKEELSILTTG